MGCGSMVAISRLEVGAGLDDIQKMLHSRNTSPDDATEATSFEEQDKELLILVTQWKQVH